MILLLSHLLLSQPLLGPLCLDVFDCLSSRSFNLEAIQSNQVQVAHASQYYWLLLLQYLAIECLVHAHEVKQSCKQALNAAQSQPGVDGCYLEPN